MPACYKTECMTYFPKVELLFLQFTASVGNSAAADIEPRLGEAITVFAFQEKPIKFDNGQSVHIEI